MRNRKSAKDAGARHNSSIVGYLAKYVDDRIERRHQNGALDRGDVSGVRHLGARVVIECKDYGGVYQVGMWLTEADKERGNDDADVGIVVAKRRGTSKPGDQVVFMTVRDLVALLTGERPQDDE